MTKDLISIAGAWLRRLELVVPKSTPRARQSLAWFLARAGIETDADLLARPELHAVPGQLGAVGVELSKAYRRKMGAACDADPRNHLRSFLTIDIRELSRATVNRSFTTL